MRTATFLGLLRIAIAIKPISPEAQSSLIWLIIIFIIADLVELVGKLTKRAPDRNNSGEKTDSVTPGG